MPESMTNCELCSEEIADDEVEKCDKCGLDGLCNECLGDHECDGEKDG